MARQSSITRLPPEVRSRLDALIGEGRLTVDELTGWLEARGADVSRSAVGRYRQKAAATIEHYRHAQEAARVIIADIGEQPDSKTGQLLAELLKTVLFRQLIGMQGQEEDQFDAKELALLGRTLRDVASSQKTDQEFRGRIREELRAEMAERAQVAEEQMAQVAKREGLTPEASAHLREILLGAFA